MKRRTGHSTVMRTPSLRRYPRKIPKVPGNPSPSPLLVLCPRIPRRPGRKSRGSLSHPRQDGQPQENKANKPSGNTTAPVQRHKAPAPDFVADKTDGVFAAIFWILGFLVFALVGDLWQWISYGRLHAGVCGGGVVVSKAQKIKTCQNQLVLACHALLLCCRVCAVGR